MILAVLRLFLLVAWLLLCLPFHLLVKAVLGRAPVGRIFLQGAGLIIGLRVRRSGRRPTAETLFLANHTSWLDILIMGGWAGSAFVSKAEVKDHWLLRFLADQRETLYVDRQARRDVSEQIAAVRRRFDHYLPLTVFPEGTTGDGRTLLPFRPSLLASVTPPPEGARIVPAAIDYGADIDTVAWHGDEGGLDNAKRILSRWKPIRVHLKLLDTLAPTSDRKQLAQSARQAVAQALSLQPPSAYSPAPK